MSTTSVKQNTPLFYHHKWDSLILYLMIYLPSIRPLVKYLPEQFLWLGIIGYLLITFIGMYVILTYWTTFYRFLNSRVLLIALIGIFMVINLIIYPRADALKTELRGSDQDDNLILVTEGIMRGESAYDTLTYLGNPISPGPGWTMIALPFIVLNLYALFTPASLLLGAFIIKQYSQGYAKSNLFLLVWMSSIISWEISVVGSDMIALGMFLAIVIIWSNRVALKMDYQFILVAILCGLLITSRINFTYLGVLLGIFIGKQNLRHGILFALVSTTVGLSLHGLFFAMTDGFYSPLHLIAKPKPFISFGVLALGAILCGLIGLYTVIKVRETRISWLFWGWLCLFIPVFVLSLSELWFLDFNFSLWEGANYIFSVAPIYVMGFIMLLNDAHYEAHT